MTALDMPNFHSLVWESTADGRHCQCAEVIQSLFLPFRENRVFILALQSTRTRLSRAASRADECSWLTIGRTPGLVSLQAPHHERPFGMMAHGDKTSETENKHPGRRTRCSLKTRSLVLLLTITPVVFFLSSKSPGSLRHELNGFFVSGPSQHNRLLSPVLLLPALRYHVCRHCTAVLNCVRDGLPADRTTFWSHFVVHALLALDVPNFHMWSKRQNSCSCFLSAVADHFHFFDFPESLCVDLSNWTPSQGGFWHPESRNEDSVPSGTGSLQGCKQLRIPLLLKMAPKFSRDQRVRDRTTIGEWHRNITEWVRHIS